MISTIIFRAFLIWAAVQCIYALGLFARFFSLPRSVVNNDPFLNKSVSIVICAKNEAANLVKNLPAVLSQKYAIVSDEQPYEVVVVDDMSADDTQEVLQGLQQQYAHLKIVTIDKGTEHTLQGKKFALSNGLAAAKNEWLLLTDADCMPASDNWLQLMCAQLAAGKQIVAGYGAYYATSGLLNKFIRWETMHTFLQLSTYAAAGMPYMATGRNISCTQTILQKAQNSPAWNLLPSGDDDLMVSATATAENMSIAMGKASYTFSNAKSTFADWAKQKQRHLSTGKYYPAVTQLLLAIYGITHASLWLYFFGLLFTAYRDQAICIMAIRCTIYWGLWTATALKLKERKLIYLFPLLDIGWMIYNFAFLPYILFKNKKQWT